MKRIIFLAIVIFLCIVIANLSFSLVTLWSKKDVLTETKQELLKEQEEHAQLEKQLKVVTTTGFIEEEARDKLFLGKPGESLVLFPAASPSGSQKEIEVNKAVWQQWWELFF